MTRVLFVLKRRTQAYGGEYAGSLSSGLANSVRFVVDMLTAQGVEAEAVEVIDNNAIDREVTRYRPTHCIIEALWVVPEKFRVLKQLHPAVRWTVRLHSEWPFLAGEGIALEWLYGYAREGVEVSTNSKRLGPDLDRILGLKTVYQPNYYPVDFTICRLPRPDDTVLRIGCFGAIRPLKNHLTQAVAAMRFADELGKRLEFHVNAGRVEGKGEAHLRNLRALFAGSDRHRLVEHPWMSHEDFIDLARDMDIGMQVSFSETFNIVAADLVNSQIPMVVSDEITFGISPAYRAKATDTDDIVRKLHRAWKDAARDTHFLSKLRLYFWGRRAVRAWLDSLQ